MLIQDNFGQGHQLNHEPTIIPYNDRIKRAIKTSGINLLLALISVFIPVLHFFLVPLFLFLAFYQGLAQYKQVRSLHLNKESCPVCKNSLEGVGYFDDDTLRTTCKGCRSQLMIRD